MLGNESSSSGGGKQVRFILMDTNGPLAEFESWADAYQYLATNVGHGGSIVRSEVPLNQDQSRPVSLLGTG